MTDIDALIEAVEAGEWGVSDVQSFARHCEGVIPDDVRALWIDAWGAYLGSLDAAKRLHDALLFDTEQQWPWFFELGCNAFLDPPVPAFYARVGFREHEVWVNAETPARAWLLAILRALKAKG